MSSAYGTETISHSYVYLKSETLQAGHIYYFETRNLRKLSSTQLANPDPVMYLVYGNTIVARNDDYTGLASVIIYSPSVSGNYQLVIRAFLTSTPGYCDVMKGVDGAPPTRIAQSKFGGTIVYTHWKSDERFETKLDGGGGDTYLFLIDGDGVGGHMYRDDDSGDGLCSKIAPGFEGTGFAVVGSYSLSTEGRCKLYLYYKSFMTLAVVGIKQIQPHVRG